ncbi:Multiple RNA-binding domain-containing protein 1 [Coccomyxa sp. Obi]|nr:Multiple RNA-binding domain-containing protein 1 [Coccomyxa sp. Obi]
MEDEGPQPWMTSRICVKGLPKQCSDQQLREHFSEKGDITDAKIVRTKDGQSRQFGFVGFRSVAEAQAAVKYFNRSFMGAQRLTVEFAEKYGGSHLPRAWSKYTEGTSRYKKLHQEGDADQDKPKGVRELKKLKKQQRMGDAAPEEEDPKLAEFLQLMQPRRAGTIWSNEDTVLAAASSQKRSTAANVGSAAQASGAGALEGGAAAKGSASNARKDAKAGPGRDAADEADESSGSEVEDEEEEEQVPAQKDATVVDAGVSDMEYLRSRMTSNFEESASDDEVQDDDVEGAGDEAVQEADSQASEDSEGDEVDMDRVNSHRKAGPRTPQQPQAEGAAEEVQAQTQEASIEETARLFVRNLPYSATEADLAEAFGQHGELSEVHIVMDKATRKSKGIALIQFAEAEGALEAQRALDGSIFQGRLLHVLPAHRPPPQRNTAAATTQEGENEAGKGGSGGFKAQKEAERREGAGNRAAWNTLFMRPDTVAAAVAEHYGVSRAELLDREASDLPVRMALGETHVIALTKRALGEAGVDVAALEAAAAAAGKAAARANVARSPTTLLVKNLPYTATETELGETFGKFGAIARLVLPPTRTLALVDFSEAADARRAFKALAYKRFQSVPLYLEWAPGGIFTADAPLQYRPQVGGEHAQKVEAKEPVEVAALPVGEEDAESTTIYVKNLAFATTDATLRAHFDVVVSAAGGSIRAARVAKRKGPDGNPLSSGFGFVECSSEDVAKIAIQKQQGSILDGHKLALQLSLRKLGAKAAPKEAAAAALDSSKAKGTKLVVRNVAFEATRKDVAALFAPFGQIKSCRLPKKFDGNHRGFAFVDFLTKQEAKSAADAVAGTHLYGRRLVVEWADTDEAGLDEMRAKTAARFRPDDEPAAAAVQPAAKKQRKNLDFV